MPRPGSSCGRRESGSGPALHGSRPRWRSGAIDQHLLIALGIVPAAIADRVGNHVHRGARSPIEPMCLPATGARPTVSPTTSSTIRRAVRVPSASRSPRCRLSLPIEDPQHPCRRTPLLGPWSGSRAVRRQRVKNAAALGSHHGDVHHDLRQLLRDRAAIGVGPPPWSVKFPPGREASCPLRSFWSVSSWWSSPDRSRGMSMMRHGRIMARDEEGWCVALAGARMCCSIYEGRPEVCRRFAMDGPYLPRDPHRLHRTARSAASNSSFI